MTASLGEMKYTLQVRTDSGETCETVDIGSVTATTGIDTTADVRDAIAALMQEAANYLRSL